MFSSILLVFLCFSNIINAQVIIETFFDEEIQIEIEDDKEVYNIKLKILDSISSNEKYHDELHRLNEEFYAESKKGFNRIELKMIRSKIDELNNKNHFFSFYKISTNKSKNNEFTNLLNKIYKANNAQLIIDNDRIIFHGQLVKISITQNGSVKTIVNNAYDKSNYPLTTKLIENTIKLLEAKN